MSAAPHEPDGGSDPQLPRKRARLLIVGTLVAILVLVIGYLVLVGSLPAN